MDSFNEGIILPTLIKQLRSILDRYPDDGQILKEIIQNAEDAGASKVVFLVDNSTYGQDPGKLSHEGLAQYQGPALYAYNDAVFSEDDWKGIRMLHESVKAEDPLKVGRFGLGFKSVFHMTDLPSVFSGNGIGFIDPHREFFEIQLPGCRSKDRTTTFRWLLDRDKAEIAKLKDQFEPFHQTLFGVSQSTFDECYFKGTFFRFPFRSQNMKSSDLSKTTYDREKVKDLVKSLRADAHHMLLFLKNLRSIEVFEKTFGEQPKKLLDIRITAPYLDMVCKQCRDFQKQISFEWRSINAISTTYPVTFSVEDRIDAISAATESYAWIVSQYYGGAEEASYVPNTIDKTCLPFVGVALLLDTNGKEDLWKTDPNGHVFCFLPLPLEKKSPTGLRFHVHGSFAIDQNRRHIKWPSADLDMVRVKDNALIWNQFLVNFVLPNAVCKMIDFLSRGKLQNISEFLQDKNRKVDMKNAEFIASLVYSMIPEDTMVTAQWKNLSTRIRSIAMNLSLFYTPVYGGRWLHYGDAIFDCSRDRSTLEKLLRKILHEDGRNLVSVPQHIYTQLPGNARKISASMVCESLKNIQSTMALSEKDRTILLDYFSKNLPDPSSLMGLRLIPLEDGSWTTFDPANSKEKVYICSPGHPKHLLPGMNHRILKMENAPNSINDWGAKGIFQLKHLDAYDVSVQIRTIFNQWNSRESIPIKIETWLTEDWLKGFWSYLQKHFAQNLHSFENIHIVPLGDGTIVKLSQQLPIVSKVDGYNLGGQPLNPDLTILCRQAGLRVIENLYQEVSNHRGVWNTYILQPNIRGVLSALQRLEGQIGSQKIADRFKDIPEKSKQRFNECIAVWLPNGLLTPGDIKLLRSIPIFRTVDGSGKQKATYVSLENVQLVAPQDYDLPLPSPMMLLDFSEKNSRQIGTHLGVRPLPTPDLLVNVYFPAVHSGYYSKEDLSKLMQYVCKNLVRFEQNSYNITLQAKEIHFIENKSGNLVKPSNVYEKSDLMSKLFHDQDVFPCGEFSKPAYGQALLKLGMKKSDAVTAHEVLAIAEKMSKCTDQNSANTKQSEALLELLNQYADRLLSQFHGRRALKDQLSQLSWVKISPTRPENYPPALALIGEKSTKNFMRPSEISASSYVYLIGSSRAVINTHGIAAVAKKFGWTDEPPIQNVVQHLLATIQTYDPRQKLPVQYIVQQIYRFLDQNTKQMIIAVKALQNRAWIWHGDGFAKIEQVIQGRKQGIDLRPYIYPLPVEMSAFRTLWSFCELKENCSFIEVLKAIKKANDENSLIRNKEHDLFLSVNILNEVAKENLNDDLRGEIVIPISTGGDEFEMKNIDECTYCDVEWYQHGFSVEDLDADIFLIHELVPLSTAEKLNIPSLISKTLGAEEMAIGYGQSEPLTRRLKNILRDYTDGMAVLKELIQNADDAGATEIKFLYDQRRNEDAQTILLDPGMKGLQGPALCVFNDAVFSNDDFDSIVKLSGATKESITEKIGRFGLGFNAVYNLTDVPIFISREFIVFFDPHTTYLGKAIADKRKPGIKLNLRLNRKKIQRLVHQFQTLNGIFECELGSESAMESYNGTLFRFPLRTKEQALKSEICTICYNHEEIVTLLKILHDTGHDLLLYTQNVRKITVFNLPETATTPKDMQKWYSVTKDLGKVLRNNGCNKKKATQIQTQCAILEQATAILESFKVNPTREKPVLEASSVMKFTTTREAVVPSSFGASSLSDVSHWLIVSVLGQDKSLALALRDKTLIPVGGVAARFQVLNDGRYQVTTTRNSGDGCGLLYCFLPLPIKTILPVHINGFFAIHSSRTHIYETSPQDKTDHRGIWNEALLEDAITRAYCVLLEDLACLCPDFDSYQIWPSHTTTKEAGYLLRLSESVYKQVCSSSTQLRVVKTKEDWTTMSQSKMISRQFQEVNVREIAQSTLRTILRNSYDRVVDIPERILQTIMQTSSSSFVASRILSKVEFYTDYFLPNIANVEAMKRDKLILHALEDGDLAASLQDINCIPVSPDGKELQPISELIDPSSQLAALYDAEEGRFPKWTSGVSIDPSVFEKLAALGMKRETLPWREIRDRCVVISSNPATAITRTHLVLSLADKQLKMNLEGANHVDTILRKIQCLKILPIMKKPKSFPLKWQGDSYSENQLISCKGGYLRSQMNLLCCSCPIFDEKLCFDFKCYDMKRKLGLEQPEIDPKVVVQQILEVVKLGLLTKDSGNVSAEDVKAMNDVYDSSFKWLDDFLKKNTQSHPAIKQLESAKSIFLQSSIFLEPRRCALNFPYASEALIPYMAMVPPALARSYPIILKAIGVRQEFCLTDFIQILNEIKQEAGDRILNRRQLDVTIFLIIHCTYTEVKDSKDGRTLLKEMPMPNAEGRMCLAKDLCFNNCLWLAEATERSKFSHELIPHEIASELGLQTIRQGILKQHRLGLPFGQKERLVKRIKTILREYPFNEDILKEMLQNADDAGAHEVHFIRDTRSLKANRIFEDSWKPLQGPAFCVYNDKSFRKSDLDGIQHLGEGGKSGDPTKTGQFGVGFNCVYHVTDVPTFLTTVDGIGTVLCAFDPNCKFVPDAESSNPGALFTEIERLKMQFPDVFKGYLMDNKMYDVSKAGTFFRFPLRNQETAKESEISEKPVSLQDVDSMFKKFKSDMNEALLFVNSVERISLVEVSEGKGDKDLVSVSYHVTMNMTEEAKKTRTDFHNYVLETALKLAKKKISLRDIGVKEVSYQVEIKDSENNEDVWWIVQRFGFDDTQTVPDEIVRAVSMGDLGLLPRGGVAYLVKTTRQIRRPSRLFCFLPLPVTTELPVHLNGHFSLDHESRRDLWKDEHKTYRAEWNRYLMEEVISPAYAKLLCKVRDHIRKLESYADAKIEMERYFKLFPKVGKTNSTYINKMSKSVYSHIMSKKLEILPLQSMKKDIKAVEWKNPCGDSNHQVFFDRLDSQLPEPPSNPTEFFRSSGAIRQENPTQKKETKSSIVRKVLICCGFSMFSCPVRISGWFQKADIEISVVSPEAVIGFFSTHTKLPTRCKVGNLPEKIANTRYKDESSLLALLEYVAKAPDYKTLLDGLPFLLTSDGFVRSFDSKMPTYASRFSELAPHIPHKFMNLQIMSALKLYLISDSHLCVEFKVEELAKALPGLIDDAKFFDFEGSYPVKDLEILLKPYKTGAQHWLLMLWYFLQNFVTKMPPEHDSENMLALLNPLTNCCLLPVLENGIELLYPFSKASAVIYLQRAGPACDSQNKEIATILHKLGVAEPNGNYMIYNQSTSEMLRLTSNILGGVQQPDSVLKALILLMKKKTMKDQLSNEECLCLLRYFSSNIESFKSKDIKNTIKILPFFVNFCDQQISLEGKLVYILPSTIPSIDMEICMQNENCTLLKSDLSLKSLLEFLQCEQMTVEEAYCKLIFNHFSSLSSNGQLVHMEFVKSHIQSLFHAFSYSGDIAENNKLKREYLFDRLKTLAFIPKVDETDPHKLFPPSEFYDPDNEIFKVIHKSNKFPPEPYKKWEWLSILRHCGLVKDLTNKMLIAYANAVANKAEADIDDKLISQSTALVNYVLQTVSKQDPPADFIVAIKKIKFVKPGQVSESLEQLHRQHGNRSSSNNLQFIAFQDAVLHKHHELVWTVRNLIPENIDKYVENDIARIQKLLELLDVMLEPDVESVALNAQMLFQSFKQSTIEDKQKKAATLKDISAKIFEYLSKLQVIENPVKGILSGSPCVLIEETFTLVRPTQIAIDIKSEEELIPYLYKLPLEFGKFVSFLQELGATKEFTAAQFALLMEDIATESHGNELNLEDIRTCHKAMIKLIGLIKAGQKIPGDLYLLCQDKKLYLSQNVVFVDNRSVLNRLKEFNLPILIDGQHMKFTNFDIKSSLEKLPQHQKPRYISEIVQEVVAPGEAAPCPFANKMTEQLRNAVFRNGFERIIRHCLTLPSNHATVKNLDQQCSELVSVLNRIEFLGRNKVLTYLTYEGKKIERSDQEVAFFNEVTSTNDQKFCKFNFRSTAVISISDFSEILAKVINELTSEILTPSMLQLSGIIQRPVHEIQKYLDSHQVKESGNDVAASFYPILGTPVPQRHLDLLIQDNFVFYPQQLVALELDDPFDRNEPGLPTYILVEVCERLEPEDPNLPILSARYRIRINQDGVEKIVHASCLYAFDRNRESSDIRQTAIVIYMGGKNTESENTQHETNKQEEKFESRTLAEIVDEIKSILKEAWSLSIEERNTIKKRLQFKWHPDKNPNQVDLTTKVFQILQNLIKMLTDGKSIDDYKVPADKDKASSSSTNSDDSDHDTNFDDFFDRMRDRARQYSSQRENYSGFSSRRGSSGSYHSHHEYEDFFRGFTHQPNPQPQEARRWMRQAKHNLQSAANDGTAGSFPAFDWMCIKCYEASKIAVKAVQYAKDSNKVSGSTESLTLLSSSLNDSEISRYCRELESLILSSNHLKYPNNHEFPKVPYDFYDQEKASKALQLGGKILERCSQIIGAADEFQ